MDVVTTEIHILVSGRKYIFDEEQIKRFLSGIKCTIETLRDSVEVCTLLGKKILEK